MRLLAHDRERRALLLERCRPGARLDESDVDPIDVVCGLLPRLWVRAGPPFRRVVDEAAGWAEEVPRRRRSEPALVELALEVYRSTTDAPWLVNQDLHAGNVLRAEREPWLVIDPKPLVGEREVSAVGLLRNAARIGEAEVTRWLDALAALGLDRGRLQGWGVAHALAWDTADYARTIMRAG